MGFLRLLAQSVDAYLENIRLISLFSIPFLVALPLSLALPNFSSLGAIFLRIGSVRTDLTPLDAVFIVAAFAIALFVFSATLVGINMVVKSQRTMMKLTRYELERLEEHSFRLFFIYLAVFIASLAVNLALYPSGLHSTLGALFAFAAAAVVLFAPQAVVIDNMAASHAVQLSASLFVRRFPYVVSFFVFAALLIVLNAFIALLLQQAGLGALAAVLAIAVNALFILPFLEVLKTQIYLSKYTIL
ncbi:MAG: hypothetical protein WC792_05560 [Candidatus Micrarchaeia archaeon]|jgi:hypothetical protein